MKLHLETLGISLGLALGLAACGRSLSSATVPLSGNGYPNYNSTFVGSNANNNNGNNYAATTNGNTSGSAVLVGVGIQGSGSTSSSSTTSLPQTFSGEQGLEFFNGNRVSQAYAINLRTVSGDSTLSCHKLTVSVQMVDTSIACADSSHDQQLGTCPTTGGTSEVLHATHGDPVNAAEASFGVWAYGIDPVCVNISGSNPLGTECGANSRLYKMKWTATCE